MLQPNKKISFFTAVLMDLNIILGVGIYFIPSIVAQKVGTLGFTCWLLSGVALFPILWNIALASRLFPGTAGFYSYCQPTLGKTAGFMASWAYLIGLIATGMTQALVLKQTILDTVNINFFHEHHILFNIIFIGFFALINLFSVTLITRIQGFTTLLKLFPIIAIIIVSFFVTKNIEPVSFNISESLSLMYCLPFAIFGYWGIESCVSIGHLLKGGPSKVFGVILTAFSIAVLLYTAFHFSILRIMGLDALANKGIAFIPHFMELKNNNTVVLFKNAFVWILILNYSNAVYGVFLSNIENLFTIAKKKLLPYGNILISSNKYHRPFFSVALIYISSLILFTIIPKKEIMLVLANIGIITAFFMTLLSVFVEQKKQNKNRIPVVIGFISCILLSVFSWKSIDAETIQKIVYSFPFFAWMGLGYLFYCYQLSKTTD
jgi:basic amino acid/polyamine antiporter, APA family